MNPLYLNKIDYLCNELGTVLLNRVVPVHLRDDKCLILFAFHYESHFYFWNFGATFGGAWASLSSAQETSKCSRVLTWVRACKASFLNSVLSLWPLLLILECLKDEKATSTIPISGIMEQEIKKDSYSLKSVYLADSVKQ